MFRSWSFIELNKACKIEVNLLDKCRVFSNRFECWKICEARSCEDAYWDEYWDAYWVEYEVEYEAEYETEYEAAYKTANEAANEDAYAEK
jgi:hypothetical protein